MYCSLSACLSRVLSLAGVAVIGMCSLWNPFQAGFFDRHNNSSLSAGDDPELWADAHVYPGSHTGSFHYADDNGYLARPGVKKSPGWYLLWAIVSISVSLSRP